jgi:hypothetical protein
LLKFVVAATLGIFIYLSRSSNPYLIFLVVAGVAVLDIRNPLSLKNFTVSYLLLVFGVGVGVLHLTGSFVLRDIAAYFSVFLIGYLVSSGRVPVKHSAQSKNSVKRPSRASRKGPLQTASIERALFLIITLNLLFLLTQLATYGVVGYYQGQGLLNQALSFGKASTSSGVQQIVRFGLQDSGIALVILYVKACFDVGKKVKYKYPLLILVALPIFSLSRFDAVVGAVTAIAIFACDVRLRPRQEKSNLSNLRKNLNKLQRDLALKGAGPKRTRGLLVAGGVVLAVTTALFIAGLRSGFTAPGTAQPRHSSTVSLLTSELSTAQAYGDIKANINVLGHPEGKTILLPLVFKVVPRSWYPNKPLNSGAYYMSIVRPAEYAAGYALPPTYFGDALLSFGFGGALALSLLLGALASRIDVAYKRVNRRWIPLFLLIFANYYAVLRDPISESLAGIILMALVWWIGNSIFRAGNVATLPVQAGGTGIGRPISLSAKARSASVDAPRSWSALDSNI